MQCFWNRIEERKTAISIHRGSWTTNGIKSFCQNLRNQWLACGRRYPTVSLTTPKLGSYPHYGAKWPVRVSRKHADRRFFCRCEQICRWFQWERLDCNLLSNIIPHLRPANAWSWCLQATRDRIKLSRAMQQPRDKHCGRCWKLDHLEEEVTTRSIIPLKHNSKSPRVQRKAERICGKQGSTPHLREIYGMVETREFFLSEETLLEAPNTPQNRSTSNNCYQNFNRFQS